MEEYLQLHESLEIVYHVTHYVARLSTMDGAYIVHESTGETIEEALANLLAYLCGCYPAGLTDMRTNHPRRRNPSY